MPPPVDLEVSVSEFVALLNQTLEFAYPSVVITGELANLRVSKNRWVYFDLKDELASVKFFGSVYNLPGPLEDGMLIRVKGQPRLHQQYGFSVNIMNIQLAGEGTIRRAAEILQAKLAAEGLFDEARKRILPYPPARIGLITSRQSAAYADFIKILNARWQGIDIRLIDVQVQGEPAPEQIVKALEQFNTEAELPEAIVLIRGGGSAEDLAAFSTEQVTRAVAASRVPTLVAIGHEVDVSLAELAADRRASTPSNAAELLVPDRRQVARELRQAALRLEQHGTAHIRTVRQNLTASRQGFDERLKFIFDHQQHQLTAAAQLLNALNPAAILRRGYAIVRQAGQPLRAAAQVKAGVIVEVQLADGRFNALPADGNGPKE
ncbi:MAG TPA: exodeoxyribonuclease VII large subunit [Candidatus Dormibacteraeota bacterium]|nr:exodeoxyribonuclease VII large subunit [Candidatus Dormibacteraeota bacterium]